VVPANVASAIAKLVEKFFYWLCGQDPCLFYNTLAGGKVERIPYAEVRHFHYLRVISTMAKEIV